MNGNVHRYKHTWSNVNYLLRSFEIVQIINAYKKKKQYNLERTLIFRIFKYHNLHAYEIWFEIFRCISYQVYRLVIWIMILISEVKFSWTVKDLKHIALQLIRPHLYNHHSLMLPKIIRRKEITSEWGCDKGKNRGKGRENVLSENQFKPTT